MHKDGAIEIENASTQTYTQSPSPNQHNGTEKAFRGVAFGFLIKIWCCLSAMWGSWFPTTKTQEWVKTKQRQKGRGFNQ